VTLVLDADDVRNAFGDRPDFVLSYARYRVEAGSELVGLTFYTGFLAHIGTILSLALVDTERATPGTELTVVWGELPGPGADSEPEVLNRLRATVQPAPYNEFARTQYRKDA
jgi:hypothetical protein